MKKTLKAIASVIMLAMLMSLASSAYVVFDNCDLYQVDETLKWGGSYAECVTDEAPEGTGYIKAYVVDGIIRIYKNFDHIDLSEYTEGYLNIKIYVEDAAAVTGGCIELNTDNQLNRWNLMDMDLEDGWNDLSVKLAEGTVVNGGLDYSNFTGMIVYTYTGNTENALGVDDISIGLEAGAKDLVIDTCDAISDESDFSGTSWGAYGGALVAEMGEDAAKEGEGSIYSVAKDTIIIMANLDEPLDISEYEDDGYLMFWLYYSDGTATSLGGQIELTSSGVPDVEEISWNLNSLYYIDTGWNPVVLPFSTATTHHDTVDFTQMDCFRIYDFVLTGTETEMRVDNICIGTKDDAIALGFLPAEEETEEESVAEETEAETEAAADETEEAAEETEAETEAEDEADASETNAAADADVSEENGSSTGLIIGIVAAVVVIAAVVIAVVAKKNKK